MSGLDAGVEPDCTVLADFVGALDGGDRAPFEGLSVGASVVRVFDAMDEFGCPDNDRAYAALVAGGLLYSENDRAGALVCFERGLALRNVEPTFGLELRLEYARRLIGGQRLAEAAAQLESLRVPLGEAPIVRALLADPDNRTAPESFEDQQLLRHAMYWLAACADLEKNLGRVSAIESFVTRYESLARRFGDDSDRRLSHLLRINLALTQQLYDEVDALAEEALASGLFPASAPVGQASIALPRTLVQHELLRRTEPRDFRAADQLWTLCQEPRILAAQRSFAAQMAAAIYAEAGQLDRAREALAIVRATGPDGGGDASISPMERANLDAIEMRIASGDPAAAGAALERLEASTREFIDQCAKVAELSSGVALLHFAQRERVLSELIFGCLAVDGPSRGARRALRWVYESQRAGGLGRALGIPRDDERFDADLRQLTSAGRGLCVFQSGRVASFLFLIDEGGVAALPIAPGWRLRQDATEISNVVTRAVQLGSTVDDASVREALAALTSDVGVAELLECLQRWKSATIIGDESVGHLPLALLDLPDGRRVGEVTALGYAPSIAVAAELARRAGARPRVAAREFRLELVGLPPPPSDIHVSPARLDEWRERLRGRVRFAVGADAVPAALDVLGKADALQVVAHGAFDTTRDSRAGFTLAGDSPESANVWADEVEQRSAARLTLLAVCRASRRPVLRGDDGRTGLAASFLIAGSDCVVQTPIDLEVDTAIDFFEAVSALVADGRSPAQALCEARRAFATRGKHAPLQDYLVHAWGAADEPIATPPAASEASQTAPEGGLARWWLAPFALVVAWLLWAALRRRPAARAG